VKVLSPTRVLDLSDERGISCRFVLAELGADVVRIEPPGGSRSRRQAPFAAGVRGPERLLFWWAYERSKRSLSPAQSRTEPRNPAPIPDPPRRTK
jgi:crotonobetainyl-CoA:carnitine CoA-transferase CaiB-like acyl-CoA transferase